MIRLRKWLPHLFVFALLFAFLAPVAGVRHLWQDEMETAERSRSILFYGVPKVVDPEGRLSLNAGGREIEDGDLHRYTPWGQFYIGATGLGVSRTFGLSDDTGVRIPFVALHAATSAILSYGLVTAGWPVALAVASSTLFGFQSVRILNNRSCRYHAALDFLFIIGLLAIRLRSSHPRVSKIMTATSVFLLPQMHTLGGSLLASTLVVFAVAKDFLGTERKVGLRSFWQAIRHELAASILPALASLGVIAILCRPLAQSAWSAGDFTRVWGSLRSTLEISYSLYGAGLIAALLIWKRDFKTLAAVAIVGAWIFATVKILDFHPFSQTRYYLSVPIFFLFWVVAWGLPTSLEKQKRWVWAIVFVGILLPDLQGIIPPLEGVRVVLSDYKFAHDKKTQPLMLAFEKLRSMGGETQPVLVDYVPQFANWYLRSAQAAMVPEPSGATKLNAGNPLFERERQMPEWHLFYERQNGYWPCADDCSFHRSKVTNGKYKLVVNTSAKSAAQELDFCVIEKWQVSRWNNAPFVGYNAASTTPEGPIDDVLFLARRCRN